MDKQKERFVEVLKLDPCPSPWLCSEKCKYVGNPQCFSERYADHLIAHGAIFPPVKVGSIVYAFVNGKINVFIVNKIELCVEIGKQSATYYGIGKTSECPAIKFVDGNIGVGVFLTLDEAKKIMKIDDGTT